jgi:hypothetical protein
MVGADWVFGLSLSAEGRADPLGPSLLGLYVTMRSVQVSTIIFIAYFHNVVYSCRSGILEL